MKIGDRVQHRGWFWKATVIEVPTPVHYLSNIRVRRDDGVEQDVWMPSIITDVKEFLYDWSDEHEPIEQPRKSKTKR